METTDLSKIRRERMLNTIREIKSNITEEAILNNLSLIENELTKKKYGLIWEEHEERVDKELETQIWRILLLYMDYGPYINQEKI